MVISDWVEADGAVDLDRVTGLRSGTVIDGGDHRHKSGRTSSPTKLSTSKAEATRLRRYGSGMRRSCGLMCTLGGSRRDSADAKLKNDALREPVLRTAGRPWLSKMSEDHRRSLLPPADVNSPDWRYR